MVVVAFLMIEKVNQVRFFEEILLMANLSSKIVFKMLFLTLNNTNINFLDWKLWWRIYIIQKIFLTIKYIKLIGKKEFATAIFDLEYETFLVYVVLLNSTMFINANIHPSCKCQIANLITKKTLIKMLVKYVNFVNIFSPDLVLMLF